MQLNRRFLKEHFVIHTGLNPDAIKRILEAQMEAPKTFRSPFSRKHKMFQGTLTGDTFSMSKIIHNRNSFLPIIEGTITGSLVEIEMHLHKHFETTFLVVAGGGFLLFLLQLFFFTTNALPDYDPSIGILLLPLGILIFVPALAFFFFKLEASRQKEYLRNLFNGTIEEK
jgi:hypothetical protein